MKMMARLREPSWSVMAYGSWLLVLTETKSQPMAKLDQARRQLEGECRSLQDVSGTGTKLSGGEAVKRRCDASGRS